VSELHRALEEILDEAVINSDTVFKDLVNWDSLSILSVIAHLDKQYGINLDAKTVGSFETLASLEKFIRDNSNK